MITVRMIQYWNDYHKKELREQFKDLGELADWIFSQMRADYTSGHGKNLLSFPKCDAPGRIYEISVRPEYGGYVFWIKQIEDRDLGIIFSDGTFTAGQKHCTKAVREWLAMCEGRKKKPSFNFAPDQAGTGAADKENPVPTPMIVYDPKFWKRAENITVRQFCDYIGKYIPPDAVFHVCGESQVYLHLSADGNVFSIDDSALSDLPEYEDYEAGEFGTGENL